MRMPEPGPFGETLLEARVRAIVAASFVNKPGGGWVASVVTAATHLLFFCFVSAIDASTMPGTPATSSRALIPFVTMPLRCLLPEACWPQGPAPCHAPCQSDPVGSGRHSL